MPIQGKPGSFRLEEVKFKEKRLYLEMWEIFFGSLLDWHVIEVEVTGPSQADGRTFTTKTIRKNPADPGAVTGTATFGSFFSSLLNAARRHGYHPETGFILC